MVAYFDSDFLVQMLFCHQSCSQRLLHMRRHEDATLRVFRMCPTMDPYSISPGHSPQYRQQSFELRTHRHTHFIRQCRNQTIRIFHRITQRNQRLLKSLFSYFEQSPSHGSPIRRHSDQFVVTHIHYKVLVYFSKASAKIHLIWAKCKHFGIEVGFTRVFSAIYSFSPHTYTKKAATTYCHYCYYVSLQD